MSDVLGVIATLCTALFCGAAVYINLVEHPARMGCDTRVAFAQWAPSYQRATLMQASLAVLGALAGLAVWALGGGGGWLLGAVLIGAVVPFTFLAIMPTNRRLLAPDRNPDAPDTRQLLEAWGRLHAVRSVLSLLATLLYLALLVR